MLTPSRSVNLLVQFSVVSSAPISFFALGENVRRATPSCFLAAKIKYHGEAVCKSWNPTSSSSLVGRGLLETRASLATTMVRGTFRVLLFKHANPTFLENECHPNERIASE